jgi:hypothetical protein
MKQPEKANEALRMFQKLQAQAREKAKKGSIYVYQPRDPRAPVNQPANQPASQ